MSELEIEITPAMVDAGVDAAMSRYLELENPDNLPEICRDVIRAALQEAALQKLTDLGQEIDAEMREQP